MDLIGDIFTFIRDVLWWGFFDWYGRFRQRRPALTFVIECVVLAGLAAFILGVVGLFIRK